MTESRHISWNSIWRLAVVVGLLVFAYYSRTALSIFLSSLIIFSAFDPIVDWFERKKLGRIFGTIFIYLFCLGLIVLAFIIIAPVFYREILGVADLIPSYSEKFLNYILGSKFADSINQVLLNYSDSIIKSGSAILSIFFNLVGGITAVLSTLLISFYLLIRKDGVNELFKSFLPQSLSYSFITVWDKVRRRVGHWFLTQLLISFLVGLSVYISLSLLGIKYSLVLGILAGILEIVPVVGPIFAGAISAFAAFPQSLSLSIWVIAIFIVIQQLESNILVPLLMKKSVGINPALVIISIIVGAKLGGIMGIVFAIPVMVLIEEVIREINRKKSINLPKR
jgi:predicted PurR-regulated permease PerM